MPPLRDFNVSANRFATRAFFSDYRHLKVSCRENVFAACAHKCMLSVHRQPASFADQRAVRPTLFDFCEFLCFLAINFGCLLSEAWVLIVCAFD